MHLALRALLPVLLVPINCTNGARHLPARDQVGNAVGLSMVVIRGPVEFQMGSPVTEVGRNPAVDSPDEVQHTARIPRSYAIATHEVTVAQFRRFLDALPEVRRQHGYADDPARMDHVMQRFSPHPDNPQIAVTWYEAAMFCNWLSQQDRLPESEWVYPTPMRAITHGMRMPAAYLHRIGYRLPTEAEWEYAARGGTTTARFFGDSVALLDEYAVYSHNPPKRKNDPVDPSDPQRTSAVGQRKANPFGLFDIYGNVWEWTQSRVLPYPAEGVHDDIEDVVLTVSDSAARDRRGGAFPYEAAMQRSAARGTIGSFPYLRRDNVGFRVARTVR